MKWDITPPSIGTLRVRHKFAWVPTSVFRDDSTQEQVLVWFETYAIKEEYKPYSVMCGPFTADKLGWVELRRVALYPYLG